MRSIDTVRRGTSAGTTSGKDSGTTSGTTDGYERRTMTDLTSRTGHDCIRYPAVRDPEWVESSFGHA